MVKLVLEWDLDLLIPLCREDGLLECLRIGDFHSILASSRSRAFDSMLLEPIVSVKQEPRNPSQDYQA